MQARLDRRKSGPVRMPPVDSGYCKFLQIVKTPVGPPANRSTPDLCVRPTLKKMQLKRGQTGIYLMNWFRFYAMYRQRPMRVTNEATPSGSS